MNRFIQKGVISLMVMVMISLNLQIPLAHAAMVSTDQMLEQQQSSQQREKVVAFLNRAEVQQELQQQGIAAEDAVTRVAHLSDQEVELLAGKIDQLPAGGIVGALIGAALFIFVVLLVTDILGFTDVYPFVHSHGH
ncbi:PA2779 family protein [Mariprofundus sp. NF]|uniref:PA2779 family protein n=1 Tax=Mariprofundus sp. NF TaxID=2608716 RepID=UPI0015A095C2|nr:PA2779 family protein [Mariprofundus sp. NF]NWF38191.1 PA2779 family protein [Mariprofundus sp. NF]